MLSFKKPTNIPLMKGFQKMPYLILVRHFLVASGLTLKTFKHQHTQGPTPTKTAKKPAIFHAKFSLSRILKVYFFAQIDTFSFGNASNSMISREVSMHL